MDSHADWAGSICIPHQSMQQLFQTFERQYMIRRYEDNDWRNNTQSKPTILNQNGANITSSESRKGNTPHGEEKQEKKYFWYSAFKIPITGALRVIEEVFSSFIRSSSPPTFDSLLMWERWLLRFGLTTTERQLYSGVAIKHGVVWNKLSKTQLWKS